MKKFMLELLGFIVVLAIFTFILSMIEFGSGFEYAVIFGLALILTKQHIK